jgi:hypothetical protein
MDASTKRSINRKCISSKTILTWGIALIPILLAVCYTLQNALEMMR